MSFLKLLFGGVGKQEPPWDRWEDFGWENRGQMAEDFLNRVAKAAAMADSVVAIRAEKDDVELRGKVRGYWCRAVVGFGGRIESINARYASELDGIYLTYDPKLEETPPRTDLKAWSDADKLHVLAPGIFLDGASADRELKRFRELPEPLQSKVLQEIRALRIRYFRSSTGLDVTLWDDVHQVHDPVSWLARTLHLSAEVAEARGAEKDGQEPKRRVIALGRFSSDDPWGAVHSFASALTRDISGARVVERKNDEAIDLRWEADGIPLRLVFDLRFGDLEAFARAEGVSGEFELTFDPNVAIEQKPDEDQDWDSIDAYVFFARSIFIQGPESIIRQQAALIQALPSGTLETLLQVVTETGSVEFEGSVLRTVIDDLADVKNEERAVRIARVLGTVAKSLPRGAVACAAPSVRCAYCQGIWFPAPERTNCPRCGAPA